MTTIEEMKCVLRGRFWETVWQLRIRRYRIKCWFTDHDLVGADEIERFYGQADYCRKCHIDWPQETNTLSTHLNHIYVWFVLRDWAWLERLDLWLLNNYRNRLPGWWEY